MTSPGMVARVKSHILIFFKKFQVLAKTIIGLIIKWRMSTLEVVAVVI